MSKYEPLWTYIKSVNKDVLNMSFEQIASILGFDIDHAFLNAKKELVEYGYIVKTISMKNKFIMFEKMS